MKNLKKGFTLVELIVVITILAILGTIAFISLQGYSGDARNTKRTSDLTNVNNGIKAQLTQGQSYLSFVVADPLNQVASPSVGGAAVSVPSGTYNAGKVNYTALPTKASDFQDPLDTKPYAIGVTTKSNGAIELSASMEQGGTRVARVFGDYTPRTTGQNVTIVSTGTLSVKIGTADINKIKAGDTVTGGGVTSATVLSVSADGQTLNLSAQPTALTPTLNLSAAEMAGLIDGVSTAGAIIDGSSVNLPY